VISEILIYTPLVVNGIPTPTIENFMIALIIGWEEIELISILLLIIVIVSVPKLVIFIWLLTWFKENAGSKWIIIISF